MWGWIHEHEDDHEAPTTVIGEDAEREMTAGAIRTDFILSAEIMVIALAEVADKAFWPRLIILVVVAIVITVAVYGVVAFIVKMDDIGLNLAERKSRFTQKIGLGLVAAMPKLLSALSAIGTVAMLWVGGHILLVGTDNLGWHWLYGQVHHAEEAVHHAVAGVGGLLAWLVNTAASAVVGLIVGAVVVAVVHVLPFGHKERTTTRTTTARTTTARTTTRTTAARTTTGPTTSKRTTRTPDRRMRLLSRPCEVSSLSCSASWGCSSHCPVCCSPCRASAWWAVAR